MLLFEILAAAVIGYGLVYFLALMALGIRESRRARQVCVPLPRAAPKVDQVYFLLPCLNEAVVVADTVRALVADGHVVVIDDASDDATAELARGAGGERVTVIHRVLPGARRGKGAALNAGFPAVLADVRRRGLDPARVVLCVMDADGRMSVNATAHVLALFDDPSVGGVQLPVRIRNNRQMLGRMQDLEFWGLSAVSQYGRNATRTVSLGGNGQFTRLSALLEIGAAPWRDSLTEDLDLAISLSVRGWALLTTPRAWVEQEGLLSWRLLVRQRSRWMQGHMRAGLRLPEVWAAPKLSDAAALEMTLYLGVPWGLVLPWSLIYPVALLGTFTHALLGTGGLIETYSPLAFAASAVIWYLLSFFPTLLIGYLYQRQNRAYGIVRSLLVAHVYILTVNNLAYLAAWLAVYRMLSGLWGWEKTTRAGPATATATPMVPAPRQPGEVRTTTGTRR